MKSEITKQSDTEATVKISLDQAALTPLVAHTFDKLRGKVKVAGFRPGKAPDHIVERELGSNTVQSELIEHAIAHSYADAVKEHALPVIAPPNVNVSKFVPYTELEYIATTAIMPKITVADYKKIKKTRPAVKVEQSEIDQTLADLQKRFAEKKAVDRTAQMGDEIVFDFDGFKDGQPVAGASAQKQNLMLGSKTFIPGFEEELVGLKSGDAKEFDITFPKDYGEKSLAGQKVTFRVKVETVSEVKLPAWDDKLAAQVGPFQTLSDLQADVADQIKVEKENQASQDFEQSVLDEIVEKSQFSVPETLMAEQLERQKKELESRLAASGLDLEKYLSLSGQNLEQLEAEMRPRAKKQIGLAMILSEIAKTEGLKVTPAEIDTELARLKASYQDSQMQAELAGPSIREEIYNHLMASATVAKILEYVEG